MPAADPADQQAARDFEQSLRYDVFSGRAPQAKLDWFLALPKRVRRSRRLIDEALGPLKAAEERAKEELVRRQTDEFLRNLRLTALRQQPQDLSCLRSDGAPWAGIGRRKKRCRAFRATGQAYVLHQTLATPSAAPVFTLDHAPDIPSRPATPPGLREAAFGCVGLLASASGVNAYGHNTPYPMPPLPTRIIRRPPSPLPPPKPQLAYEGETIIDGQLVDCYLAYVMAMGRWEGCKWGSQQSLREAAQSVADTDELQPRVLDNLINIFSLTV
ncbi:hypothetical protein FRC08_017682 [Ceratobasidium sp. 394]|nr:hypothetical protein FRC08_017682 [Ceratobasidium sp. 394]